MDDLEDLIARTHDYFFRFSSWSKVKKASFIATIIYAASLYGFIAVNRIKDNQLNEELKQQGVVVRTMPDNQKEGILTLHVLQNGREIDSMPIGNRRLPVIDSFITTLGDKLGIHNKIGRILIENDPEKLVNYRTEGYKKLVASYYIISSSFLLAIGHPIGFIIAAEGVYINWDGETGGYSQRKIQSLIRAKTNNLESELERKKMAEFFREREPNWTYLRPGLYLCFASMFGSWLYIIQKYKKNNPLK